MAETWFNEIESRIFTQVKYMLTAREKAPYPKLACTATSETAQPAKFPTLYLYETQEETGDTLDGETVNAVRSTVYIRVWSNATESECKKILSAAAVEMKRFRYHVHNLPTATITGKIAYGEIMCRRVIGDADTL